MAKRPALADVNRSPDKRSCTTVQHEEMKIQTTELFNLLNTAMGKGGVPPVRVDTLVQKQCEGAGRL